MITDFRKWLFNLIRPLDCVVFEIVHAESPWTDVYHADARYFEAERPQGLDIPGVTSFRSITCQGMSCLEVGYRADRATPDEISAWLHGFGLTLRRVQ